MEVSQPSNCTTIKGKEYSVSPPPSIATARETFSHGSCGPFWYEPEAL
ncbi:hypothetical protein TCARB_0730 [Thermofilum adornatum 1505]|uniref:Uncharacterized protein n=1 Tax=Thermofilum adornatum 1505 TaxID=697581 RepID=A0A3G1A4Z1_9CREN|nr:hypothetical protein TCARB_0730 [Thermofilum adornatum 1505]